MTYKTATTRQILKALRAAGLTARSGCAPLNAFEFCNVEVHDAKVVDLCAFSVLGLGCWNHPDYNKTVSELAEAACLALSSLGCEFRHIPGTHGRTSNQIFVNGYKA